MNVIEIKNEHQINILKELMFLTNAHYSDLSKSCLDHDLFNHHLKELQNKGYILKDNKTYLLTSKGKSVVDFMEENSKIQDRLKTSIFIWLTEGDKVLLHKRLKHPYYGYIGSISGKMKRGEKIFDTVKREVFEEIEVIPSKIQILGTKRATFLNKENDVTTDGLYLVCLVSKWKGEINYEGIEGNYFWEDILKVLDYEKMFKKGISFDISWIQEFLQNPDTYKHHFAEFEVPDLDF